MVVHHDKGIFPWFKSFLLFSLIEKIFLQYLNWRQLEHLKKRELPKIFHSSVTDEEFQKSVDYSLDKLKYSIFESSFSFIIHMAMFLLMFYPYLWKLAGTLSPVESFYGLPREYVQSLIFSGIQVILSQIVELPFGLYFDFVIEARHGFNKKTLGLFFTDLLKSLMLTCLIGGPVICIIIAVVKWGGRQFYFLLWLVSLGLTFFFIWFHPNVIAPLFNKYETLKDEGLKTKIEELALKLKYPLKKIYEVDASKRSAHSNAYLYGFGNNKRMVLFDTLLTSTHERILAVVGHELGHWMYSHTLKNLVFASTNLFVMFYLFGFVIHDSSIYQSFGFDKYEKPVLVGLFLFFCIYEPISLITNMISTLLSRRFEFQADEFSSSLGMNKDLQESLLELHSKNLGTFSVDSWYAWFHYSHPQLVERLEALQKLNKKQL